MPTAQVYQLCAKYHELAEELALILRSLKIYKKRKKKKEIKIHVTLSSGMLWG